MKNHFIMFITAVYLAVSIPVAGAQQHDSHAHHTQHQAKAKTTEHDHATHDHHQPATKLNVLPAADKQQTEVYVCPMHPEVRQHEPGRCPICKMALVAENTADEHAHHTMHQHTAEHTEPHKDHSPAQHEHSHHQPENASVIQQLTGQQQATYVCPMHPQIRQGEPGSCPICGMDLVLQKPAATDANHAAHAITVNGNMQQALGIRTATATHRTLQPVIETLAQVQYPEDAIHHSHIRAQGWIEQLYVRTTGQQVKAGDKLFTYYAPELVVAQDDYLQAWQIRHQANGKNLLQRSETRLRLLGLTDSDISYLQQHQQSQHRITTYAKHSGIVTALNIRDGMYIQPGDTLLELTNLDNVWLLADITESQRALIKPGMQAHVTVQPSQPPLATTVDYIYPELDKQSRSLKARLLLKNPQRNLHPNSLLPVSLLAAPANHALAIPRDAVLLSHKGSRVIVRHDDHFSVRQITTGIQADGYTQVLSGLEQGEEVVVSGQFLLDAEASLSQLPTSQMTEHQHQH